MQQQLQYACTAREKLTESHQVTAFPVGLRVLQFYSVSAESALSTAELTIHTSAATAKDRKLSCGHEIA